MKNILILLLFTFNLFSQKASYYGENFHGKFTASMELYDTSAYTAAHCSLPFGTVVEITNLNNNKSVVVRVNDRGAFKMDSTGTVIYPLQPHPEREFDLSPKAFSQIANLSEGVIPIIWEHYYPEIEWVNSEIQEKQDIFKNPLRDKIKSILINNIRLSTVLEQNKVSTEITGIEKTIDSLLNLIYALYSDNK